MTGFKHYCERVLTAGSVFLNVVLGGYSNQTFSARNHQWHKENRLNAVKYIDKLLGKGHCSQCWAYWKIRDHKW